MPPQAKTSKSRPIRPKGVAESPQDQFVDLNVVVSRLVMELTEHRVRQRALLEVLRDGEFPWSKYLDALRAVRKRDHDALLSAIVLEHDAFDSQFGPWIENDSKRYLFELKPQTTAPQSPAPSKSRPRKKRS